MSALLKNIGSAIKNNKAAYAAARFLKYLPKRIMDLRYIRIIQLENSMVARALVDRMPAGSRFNSVIDDLAVFTGLSNEQVCDRLLRKPGTDFISEFRWHAPKDNNELTWFYRCSYGYLFGNAIHGYWKKLDFLDPRAGRVLDYGAGVGNNVITLAMRGFEVDYFEISCIQEAFARFRVARRGLKNVSFIPAFADNKFDPVGCITDTYGAIILRDVLEHVPDYHILLEHLIAHLKTGGYIIENTPFSATAGDVDIHLCRSMDLKEAMKGMEPVGEGIWRKL